jgi:hypothetical protein
MKQISLATAGFQLLSKRTRKRVFLDEMNLVVPWAPGFDSCRPQSRLYSNEIKHLARFS